MLDFLGIGGGLLPSDELCIVESLVLGGKGGGDWTCLLGMESSTSIGSLPKNNYNMQR